MDQATCVRQLPVFTKEGVPGIFVPLQQTVEDFCGVPISSGSGNAKLLSSQTAIYFTSMERNKDSSPTFQLDDIFPRVKTKSDIYGSVGPSYVYFYLSTFQLTVDGVNKQSANDMFVGYINTVPNSLPLYLYNGYISLKVSRPTGN